MSIYRRLAASIAATKRTLDDARDALRHINDPKWQDQFGALLDQMDECRRAHEKVPMPSVANDYANLAGLLRQIRFSDEDQDRDRFRTLRGARGSLLEDVREILDHAAYLNVHPTQPIGQLPDTAILEIVGREGRLIALQNRIISVETMLKERLLPEAAPGMPRRQVLIVNHYVKDMRRFTTSIRLSMNIGDAIDIAVIERAASAMGRATVAMIDTVSARTSIASQGLRNAMTAIGKPVKKLVSGVRILVQMVLRSEARSRNPPPPPPMPKDYRNQAIRMLILGRMPPLHWIPHIQDLNFTNCMVPDISLIASFGAIKRLYLTNTNINSVSPLANLKNLQRLHLGNTSIVDIYPLSVLDQLESLDLSDTKISDVTPLSALRNLRILNLRYSNVVDIEPLSETKNLTIFVESSERADKLTATLAANSSIKVEQKIGF